MTEYKFHCQYGPGDLKAIREVSEMADVSPASVITVWAVCFAVSLIVIGAIGSWSVVVGFLVFAIVFLVFLVRRLQSLGYSNREYFVRTFTCNDLGVIEEFGESRFEKTWGAIQSFSEKPHHFFLQHYDKHLAIPKRSIADDQLEVCRQFLKRNAGSNSDADEVLDSFKLHFQSGNDFPVHSFRWRDNDFEQLASVKLQVFDRDQPIEPMSVTGVSRRTIMFFGLMIVFVMLCILAAFAPAGPVGISWILLLTFLAIVFPFVTAVGWQNWAVNKARNRKPNVPDEEILITVDETGLIIGYPGAVSQYAWVDIARFYYSERMIGFRPKNGMVHVIVNHAFGSFEKAIEFLQMADQFKRTADADGSEKSKIVVDETGNPFQPPGIIN